MARRPSRKPDDTARGRNKGARWQALTPVLCAAVLVASLALVVTASVWHSEVAFLPVAAADGADGLSLNRDGGTYYAVQPALHSPAKLHLHPSTLTLSGYPAVGGGAAELVFTVTYAGDARQAWGAEQGPAEPPVVRLDVTGSEQEMYRVTNITSNIGTASPDIFEPYDHESETVRAELGATYTVRAMVEFVAEGIISVYAFGFDADIVTANVAASEFVSMPHSEYVATRQNYLEGITTSLAPTQVHVDIPAPEKRRAADQTARPFTESSERQMFNATGTVMTENWNATRFVPVHGIEVCVYDWSSSPHTLLHKDVDDPACDYTDTSGRYEILNVSGVNPDDMTTADVLVSVKSRGYDGAIDLKWYEPANNMSYAYNTTLYMGTGYPGSVIVNDINLSDAAPVVISGRTTNFVLRSTADDGMAGAARIISAMSDGMAFFEEHGQYPANLNVVWNHMDGTSIRTNNTNMNGSFYLPRTSTIHLDGALPRNATHNIWIIDASRDRHTILHEYGHHVQNTHYPKFEQDCPVHYIHKKYDEACALGEGWAQLVPHLVDESAEVQSGFISRINIETGQDIRWNGQVFKFTTFEVSGRPVGEKVEGSVAAAMWDMADDAVDSDYDMSSTSRPAGSDNIAAGVDTLLGVFFAGDYDTFADFYDRWEINMRHNSAEDVAILHGMAFSIPSNTSYYRFAGELGGVLKYEMTDSLDPTVSNLLQFWPRYVDVTRDGSIIAVASERGRGLQIIDARLGEHKGLYAAHGYDYTCTLKEDTSTCLGNNAARATPDLASTGFTTMDGIAFGLNSSVVLVSDRYQDRVQVIGTDGGYLGGFGTFGDANGEFYIPAGLAFLADDATVAVADAGNNRIQTFQIADNGDAQYDGQFVSYNPTANPSTPWQRLATGHDGALYAADDYANDPELASIWKYPSPHDRSMITRIDDPSLRRLGGIAVDRDGLVYVTDAVQGRIRVYDLDNLRENVSSSSIDLAGRPLTVHKIQGGTGLGLNVGAKAFIDEFGSKGVHSWQLAAPFGIALGPSDGRAGDMRVYVADLNAVKIYEKDREMPRVESVWSHTADGTVAPGVTVEIALNFSERVTVTGTPVLALETGVAGSMATYVSGSGSSTLTFNYTVAAGAGPSYMDYGETGSLSLEVGDLPAVILDGSGNAANLTLPEPGTAGSLAANAALWIDTNQAGTPPIRIASQATFEAVEHQQVKFSVVSAGATPVVYSMAGAPTDAMLFENGTFTWTPGEEDDGMHAFVINASEQGNSSVSHVRTFRILVAEDNVLPVVDDVLDFASKTNVLYQAAHCDEVSCKLGHGKGNYVVGRETAPLILR